MTKETGYYAVIFSNVQNPLSNDDYGKTAGEMEKLAATMPGYIGFESARNEDGSGIAVSYWESEEAIKNWKAQAEHLTAQMRGRNEWYEDYTVRVAKVERAYRMNKQEKN